jgi:hypothetical protein
MNAGEPERKSIAEIVSVLRDDYVHEQRVTTEAVVEIMRLLFERVPEGAHLFVILPYEYVNFDGAFEPRIEASEYNAEIRALSRRFPTVTLMGMNEVVLGAHEMQYEFDHFERIVYFRMYERIMGEIAGGHMIPRGAAAG